MMRRIQISEALNSISKDLDLALDARDGLDRLAAGERLIGAAPMADGTLTVVLSYTANGPHDLCAVDAALRPMRRKIDAHTPRDQPVFVCDDTSLCVALWKDGAQYEHRGSVGGGWRDYVRMQDGQPADLWFTPTHWYPLPDLARDVAREKGGGA